MAEYRDIYGIRIAGKQGDRIFDTNGNWPGSEV